MPTIQPGHWRWACRWALGERACWVCRACARLGVLGVGAAGARACRASGHVAGRATDVGARGRRVAGARLGGLGAGRRRAGLARQGQAACAALAGRARAWARLVCWLGQLGARALDLIFKPVFRLGIFPESPNEHC